MDKKKLEEIKSRAQEIRNIERKEKYNSELENDLLQELSEIKDLEKSEELNNKIEELRADKKETNKSEFISELQAHKEKIQNDIETQNKKINEAENERKNFLDTIKENKTILGVKKPDSKVYQAASEENAQCIIEARKRATKIKRLNTKLVELTEQEADINNLLNEFDENKEKIEQQENEMWEEYRKEEKKSEEVKPQVSRGQETKQQEESEKITEGIVKKIPKTEILSINCRVADNGVPIYTVKIKMKDDREEMFETSVNGNFKEMTDEIAEDLKDRNNILEAKKYYDINLTNVLEEVDKLYKTNGVKNYKDLMKVKNQKNLDRSEFMDINYDFSELYDKSNLSEEEKNHVKQLKDIAKAGKKKHIYSYQKEPNIFQKLMKRLSRKQLPESKKISWEEEMFEHYKNEHSEDGFSLKDYSQQLYRSHENVEEINSLMQKINNFSKEEIDQSRKNKFKDGLKVQASDEDVQEYDGVEVEKIREANQEEQEK